MRKRRICWIAAGILAAIVYLFENNPGTLTLLAGVLGVPALGTITLAGKGIGVKLSVPPLQEKGGTLQGAVEAENRSYLPRGRVELTLCCRNLHTGEKQELALELGLGSRGRESVPFTLTCPYAGRVEIQVLGVRLMDPFGLFSRWLDLQPEGGFTVTPELFPCAVSLAERDRAAADSEAYVPDRPGNDPGESFGLREYRAGDAIRRIHWKLSEKTDQLMVREFGQPGAWETALLLDRAEETSAEQTDAMTEILLSLSSALIEEGICHRVFWLEDAETLGEYPIMGAEDFHKMVQSLLNLPPRQEGSLAAAVQTEHFAHVIVVSGQLPEGGDLLCRDNRVSFLIPRGAAEEGLQPDGSYVLSYELDRYAADLCRVEV